MEPDQRCFVNPKPEIEVMKKKQQSRPAGAGPQGKEVVSAAFSDPQCAALMDEAAAWRRRQGISCYRLAADAKLACSTVGRMERKLLVPGLDAMMRYCRVCGLRMVLVPAESGR